MLKPETASGPLHCDLPWASRASTIQHVTQRAANQPAFPDQFLRLREYLFFREGECLNGEFNVRFPID
jgi:hypothetical protein